MTTFSSRQVGLFTALLLLGSTAAAQGALDCQTSQERVPAVGLTPNPRAVATVPLDKQRLGYVRVGGGCEVSRFGLESVHAAVMVQNAPDGEFGWRCKGADPAFVSNPSWARASVTYCKATDAAGANLPLQCTTLTKRTGLLRNPVVEVSLTPTLVTDGYTVVSGGCDTSHFGNGSVHAENVVVSRPTPGGQGWYCQAADPPNHAQDATVEASLVACRVAPTVVTPKPSLQCTVTQGPPGTGAYPKSIAKGPGRALGGGCELSWAGNGSIHAEFMVQQGPQPSDGSWACLAADPPLISNPGTAKASVVSCGITTAAVPTPVPAPTSRKNPVIIVGGTMASEFLYLLLEARLRADGYYVEFFELPGFGLIDIREGAQWLKNRVSEVLLKTGAEKVNLIGHSQGGITSRTFIHDYGHKQVENMISLGTPHKGTHVDPKLAALLVGCTDKPTDSPICHQLRAGPFLEEINVRAADDAIAYTNINNLKQFDVFTDAATNGRMDNCDRTNAKGQSLKCNITVQEQCPLIFVEHIGLASNGAVYSGIRQALTREPIAFNCMEL
ncbi:alpha/beta fold hydrolase [Corallococcus sp. bb12-1]|uniref:alpha/beta fold hydrolase n=1 Tax=Corallococcus sp. bb12-1 TaxID=2996784 RepID=UPI00226DA81A|nr:alpha/beta fold hydrolase [Corallococcus sp. bb12-1]MCY1041553.1 alpha/beta fold hydrolase [Corallococcus sp. bb12-1]